MLITHQMFIVMSLSYFFNFDLAMAETNLQLRILVTPQAYDREVITETVVQMNSFLNSSRADGCESVKITLSPSIFWPSPDLNFPNTVLSETARGMMRDVAEDSGLNVIVVGSLDVCGSIRGAGIAGCAGTGGSIFVELRDNPSWNAFVWLHELGHSQNLSFATDSIAHTEVAERMMLARPDPNVGSLIDLECDQLGSDSEMFAPAQGSAVDMASPGESNVVLVQAENDSDAALLAIIRSAWIHGVPVEEIAVTLDAGASLEVVREFISSSLSQSSVDIEYLSNALELLGNFGTVDDKDIMENIMENGSSVFAENQDIMVQAKSSSVYSIGILSARFGDVAGITYLDNLVANPGTALIALPGLSTEDQVQSRAAILSYAIQGIAIAEAVGVFGESGSIAATLDPGSSRNGTEPILLGEFDGQGIFLDGFVYNDLGDLTDSVREQGLDAFLNQEIAE